MTSNNAFAGKVFAAFGAVAITMTLLVSSFAHPDAQIFTGVLV